MLVMWKSQRVLPILAAGALAVLSTALVRAQSVEPARVGVVNFQDALFATAEMQKKAADLEAKYTPQRDELQQLSTELAELQKSMESTTDPADAGRIRAEAARKQRQAQRLSEDLQADIEFDRNEILRDGQKRMQDVIQEVATEKGLDLVVEMANAWYFKPELEITSDATAAYDKKHPLAE